MEVRIESKNGAVVSSVGEVVSTIAQELQRRPADWLQTLKADPARLGELEQEVHDTFRHLADQVVAGLLAEASGDSAALDAEKKA